MWLNAARVRLTLAAGWGIAAVVSESPLLQSLLPLLQWLLQPLLMLLPLLIRLILSLVAPLLRRRPAAPLILSQQVQSLVPSFLHSAAQVTSLGLTVAHQTLSSASLMSLGHLSSLDSLTLLGCQLQGDGPESTAAPLERLKVPRLELLLSVSATSSATTAEELLSCVDQSSIIHLRVSSFLQLPDITVLRASQLQQLDISGGPDLADDEFDLLLQHPRLTKVSFHGAAMLQDYWHKSCKWEELCITGGNLTLQQLAAFPLMGIRHCIVKLRISLLKPIHRSYSAPTITLTSAFERILQCLHQLAFEPGIDGPYTHHFSWMTTSVCQVQTSSSLWLSKNRFVAAFSTDVRLSFCYCLERWTSAWMMTSSGSTSASLSPGGALRWLR